ncbi:MAG: quinolinate synthase NadA [Candidatus Omnitrophota bacterium]|nr:quinolinate synthase NadA [Candidatus Omnitrophota bacterium]
MSELISKIQKLKNERRAIILAHNYQLPEVQDIAGYHGDSLELSRVASRTDAKVIIFCGVHFMAETASILCPDKIILMPDINAGCPMANMITATDLRELKARHPKAMVVGYVNTSADVKAELDICCTSTNAVEVVNSLKNAEEIIFVPDKYLADFVSKRTGRRLISWDGYCPTHVKIMPEDIIRQIRIHPKAKVVVHPECIPEVIALADEALSTGKMCKYAKESNAKEFIIGTEVGIIHRLQKDNPGKKFYPASELAICPNMKRTNLEKILWSLEEMKEEVRVPEDIRAKARKAIDRMLAIK